MNVDPVTARWGDALFNVAGRKGALDDVKRDVVQLTAEMDSPAVRDYLLGTTASIEERRAKLGVVLEGMHELTRDFVFLLLERNREEVLVSLGDAFKRRSLAEEGAVEGTVESARELPQDEVEAVATALGERLGKRVRLDSRTNPDLVAGVRVFVGTSMIDLSVQGRLEGLRRQLIEAPLPVPGS